MRSAFNTDGTVIAVASGYEGCSQPSFSTPENVVTMAHSIVPRDLTPCGRRGYFLPVDGKDGDCSPRQ